MVVTFKFSVGSFLQITQTSQSGALDVYYLDDSVAHDISADDKEEDDEVC